MHTENVHTVILDIKRVQIVHLDTNVMHFVFMNEDNKCVDAREGLYFSPCIPCIPFS